VFCYKDHGGGISSSSGRSIELSCSVIASLSYTSNVSILLDILLISSLVIALLLPALFEFFHLFSNCQYLLAKHQFREPKPPKSPNAFSTPKLDSPLTCTVSNPSFQRSSRLGVCFQLLFVSVICLLLQKHAPSLTRATSAEDTLVPAAVY